MNGFCWGKPAAFASYASREAFYYRATDKGEWKSYWGKWRAASTMPRAASRITLEIAGVSVEGPRTKKATPNNPFVWVIAFRLVEVAGRPVPKVA